MQNDALPTIFFNEFDPFAANWLLSLFPQATIDDRNIFDVEPKEVVGFRRAHFFGGIGGWELAMRIAAWPAEWPVWTGSCPCQPFSCAGKGKGENDKRHLWPEFRRLIAECRPPVVFGEQVASKLGRKWFAGVRADLEALGYAVGAAGLPAASVGSPHIRQRIFWVADSGAAERGRGTESSREHGRAIHAANGGGIGGLANAELQREGAGKHGREGCARLGRDRLAIDGTPVRMADSQHDGMRIDEPQRGAARRVADGGTGPRVSDFETFDDFWGHLCGLDPALGMADANVPESGRRQLGLREESGIGDGTPRDGKRQEGCRVGDTASGGLRINRISSGDAGHTDEPGEAGGFWDAFDLVGCRDGKVRRIEPGTFPLADGVPNRVGRLRGYGNAIVPQVAARFITAFLEILNV